MTDVPTMRKEFEQYILSSPFKGNTPLGTMTINGEFHAYMEPDTDTMWLGFAIGYRSHERLVETRQALTSLLIQRII